MRHGITYQLKVCTLRKLKDDALYNVLHTSSQSLIGMLFCPKEGISQERSMSVMLYILSIREIPIIQEDSQQKQNVI